MGGEEERAMLKYILEDELLGLNEEMKNLFLDKYFYPFGKYFVKLLKVEELTGDPKDYVDSLIFALPPKPKKPKKKTLDSVLFDQSGKLNPEVVQSLAKIRQGDESMRHSFDGSFRSQRSTRIWEGDETEEV